MWKYMYTWLIHFIVQQKLIEHCRAIRLQLKQKRKKATFNIIEVSTVFYKGREDMHAMCAQLLSSVQFFVTPWTAAHQTPLFKGIHWISQDGVSCHFLLQKIFLTQRLNLCLLHLLPWQADSLPLYHLGIPEKVWSYIKISFLWFFLWFGISMLLAFPRLFCHPPDLSH